MEQLALLFHYPNADASERTIERMQVVRDAMAATPGCLEVDVWREVGTDALVAVSRWRSPEAAAAAAREVLTSGNLPVEPDDREYRERKRVVLERITAPAPPPPVFVLSYDSADDVYETAPLHFAAHRARLDQFRDRGELLLVGTFADPLRDGSMAVFRTLEGAEEFANGDPFVMNGVVRAWRVRQWNEIYGM